MRLLRSLIKTNKGKKHMNKEIITSQSLKNDIKEDKGAIL